jgi:opacity protein-like surface antigen
MLSQRFYQGTDEVRGEDTALRTFGGPALGRVIWQGHQLDDRRWDRPLFYATGGAAFQNVKFALTASPILTPLATTVNPFGWTAGGGVEFAISPNWSVKAEYLYLDFQNETIGPGTFSLIENVGRGGVNYRF